MYSNEKQVAPANHDTKEEPVLMLESPSGSESHLGFDKGMTSKLVRKIDWHIVPFLALLYLLSYLDRTNIGNARLGGLETDLGMSGLDYNVWVFLLNMVVEY